MFFLRGGGRMQRLYRHEFSLNTCTRCHLSLTTTESKSIHRLILPHCTYPCYSITEEDVINDAIVMCSVGLDVNHMLSFQAGIVILVMPAACLPGWRGLSVFSLPKIKLFWWQQDPSTAPMILGSAGHGGLHDHIEGNVLSAQVHNISNNSPTQGISERNNNK